MDAREQRGLVIAATSKIDRKSKGVFIVPSQSGAGRYTVCPDPHKPFCSCPDHEEHGGMCKHLYAVQFVLKREENPDGSVTETQTVTFTQKKTYPQNWPAYNAAQTSEKATFRALLHELCKDIEEPPVKVGRPRMCLRDAVFAAIYKVYSTVSGRRFMTDLREAHADGLMSKGLSYNSIFRVFENPETFEILRELIARSAAPLQSLESDFACDSSGFSGCRFDRWFDHKYGKEGKAIEQRVWVKAHIMCGTKTNVVTAVEIFDQHANDSPHLPALLDATAKEFNVKTVSADMAYSSRANLRAIDAAGAFPLIPFKSNAVPGAEGSLWSKMYYYVKLHAEQFFSRYHQRSNVESTFSMVKRKLGDSLRSKCDVAMKNEVLAKFVAHNIMCCIQEMHECGIDPTFGRLPLNSSACLTINPAEGV